MNARILIVAAALFVVSGCATRMIPGTQIEDNKETRAILSVIESYREAMEAKDADAIVSLVSPEFRDNGGTPSPDDDLEYENLQEALKQRFGQVNNVRLALEIRTVDVQDKGATAVYHYSLRYDLPGAGGKLQQASDIKRMELKRVDGDWKIVSGI